MNDLSARFLLFGPPVLLVGAKPVSFPSGVFPLLTLLLTAFDRTAPRSAIAARLWEDGDQEHASTNLRQVLARTRRREQELGLRLVHADATHVTLLPQGVQIDLEAFLAAPPPATAQALLAFLDLYRGDLLQGVDAQGPDLRDWIAAQRARMRARFVRLVLAGAENVGGEAGILALEQLTELEPECDEAWRSLFELHLARSGPSGAAAALQAYRARFAGEDAIISKAAASVVDERENLTDPLPRQGEEHGVDPKDAPRQPAPANGAGTPRVSILMPSGRPGDELWRLACALLEDVTLGLCRMRTFALIAPFTAWQIGSHDAPDVAQRFGINYWVGTHLIDAGGGRRLRVQLVRAATREIIWTEHYPFDAAFLAERYADIAARVAVSVAGAMEGAELKLLRVDEDPNAYRLFLSGQRDLRSLDLRMLRRARKAFRAALDIAPDFAPALSGMARTLHLEWLLLARSEKDMLHQARDFAIQAIEQDPADGRGHKELGKTRALLGDMDGSLGDLLRAETLSPHAADILAEHADALMHNSRPADALKKIETALSLNPLAPDDYYWTAGGINFFLHRYEAALSHLKRMREPTPAFRLIAACNAMLGHTSVTHDFVQKALEVHPDFRIEKWVATIPLQSADHLAHYAEALRTAGFR